MNTKDKRLLKTSSDEVSALSQSEQARLLTLLLEKIEELDGEDFYGTEGWRRGMFGVDS